jgi:hypothetical protein
VSESIPYYGKEHLCNIRQTIKEFQNQISPAGQQIYPFSLQTSPNFLSSMMSGTAGDGTKLLVKYKLIA